MDQIKSVKCRHNRKNSSDLSNHKDPANDSTDTDSDNNLGYDDNSSTLGNPGRPVEFLLNTLSLSTTSTSGSSVGKKPPLGGRRECSVVVLFFLVLVPGVVLLFLYDLHL